MCESDNRSFFFVPSWFGASTTPTNVAAAPNQPDVKLLPGKPGGSPATGVTPERQLSDLPKDELSHLAEDYGLDPTRYRTRQHLVQAIHERRQLIATLDRDAMLDVVRWGRRPVPSNASKETLAKEISRIRSMRFAGLSQRGLMVLAYLRGARVRGTEDVPQLIRLLKKQEGLLAKLNRKRRSFIAGMVAKVVGDTDDEGDYRYLPGTEPTPGAGQSSATVSRPTSVREEIEESGLFGGLANRVKRTADSYINQKLDEIEARIDRKLDEIDRRLAEWRDKEIANRIRILKITLWASVIVALLSLIYAYITQYFVK